MTVGFPLIRRRWYVLAFWVVGTLALGLLVNRVDPSANELTNFLPDNTPHSLAIAAMKEYFPNNSHLSEAVLIFERRQNKLTSEDLQTIDRVADRIRNPSDVATGEDLIGIQVQSPGSILSGNNPLKSRVTDRGQAALIVVSIPANFITLRSDRIVDHAHAILADETLPEDLSVAVTGSSGFGHDYADAADRSHSQSLHVTLVAVIVILLLVYRAPLAALVPLVAISIAAFVAMKMLAITQHFGMHVGTAEKIFVIVLLYGAGTDYSLFFLSRFREFLNQGLGGHEASSKALDATFPAILASAGTDTAGLLMLCFAQYQVFRTTGPAVAIALLVALLAAVTLVPVAAAIAGRKLFWPDRPNQTGVGKLLGFGRRKVWPNVARMVTDRPVFMLIAVLIVLGIPAVQGTQLTWVYDTLTALRLNEQDRVGNSAVGIETVKRHWPIGQIAPVQILIRSDSRLDEKKWEEFSQKLSGSLVTLEGVDGVRSLTRPLGEPLDGLEGAIVKAAGWTRITAEYLSDDLRASRLSVVLSSPAFSLEAMESVKRIRRTAQKAMLAEKIKGEVHLTGATAEMIDIRTVTQADFYRVAALSLCVIFVMIVMLMRDVILSAVMVASTVLSYFATLGISYWVFANLLGSEGLDWKVEVFLFVVMVAVGVDYNIFLVSRLAQEARKLPIKEATRLAVIHTGPVISSCGMIMAATLGSLMAGDLALLHQLGFALALGMLIDSFLIRPLLLPGFIALTGRTGRGLDLGH